MKTLNNTSLMELAKYRNNIAANSKGGDTSGGDKSYPTIVPAKDVNLYDYDGTRLYSYTAAEFANLSQLPTDVPAHDLLDDGY